MSDLTATNCGCGCDNNNNGSCGLLLAIVLFSCFFRGDNGFFGGCGNRCDDRCGGGFFGNDICSIIIFLLFFCNGSFFGNNGCGCGC